MALKYRLRALRIDASNRLRFGSGAPRYAERVWIDPRRCHRYIEAADLSAHLGTGARQMSGQVIRRWPSQLEQPLENHPKLAYCRSRWCDGMDWDQSGAMDFMLGRIAVSPTGATDRCRTREDVQARLDDLDRIRSDALRRGRLQTREELGCGVFREVGGILVHLGPDGEPVFSGAGCHRFAIALLLEAPFPAQLGCVHVSALEHLPELRGATHD